MKKKMQPRTSKPKVLEVKQKILSSYLQGKSKTEIFQEVSKDEEITYHQVSNGVNAIEKSIYNLTQDDMNNVINLHLVRYEEIFNIARDRLGLNWLAMEALKFKETLLGLHKSEVNLQVNNNEVVVETKMYDFDKLNDKDRKRLEELVNKCKRK